MKRELSDAAVQYQAEAFLSWSARKGYDYLDAFSMWAATKDFAPADLAAIREAVRTGRTKRESA